MSFSAGQVIFEEGDPGDVMYGIVEGEVEIFVQGNLAETTGEGQFFGEMALIHDRPRSATAVAKTDCQLATIDQNRFMFMVENTPFFALEVMRVMARRLLHMDRLMWDKPEPSQ